MGGWGYFAQTALALPFSLHILGREKQNREWGKSIYFFCTRVLKNIKTRRLPPYFFFFFFFPFLFLFCASFLASDKTMETARRAVGVEGEEGKAEDLSNVAHKYSLCYIRKKQNLCIRE